MKYTLLLCALACALYGAAQETERNVSLTREADRLIASYRFDDALNRLQQSTDTLDIEVIQREGYCYFRLGDYASAIRAFESVTAIDSANANALHHLGQLYSRNNQYSKAVQCYQQIIATDSLNSFYYKQYAQIASQNNDIKTSIFLYLKAVSLSPRDIEAYISLGNALLEDELYEVADSILTHATQINRSPQLRLLLAKAQLGEGKYREVVQTTEQLMSKGDTIPAYARLLGISYFQLDEFEKVIPCMRFLGRAKLKAEWIYYYLGVSFQQTNRPDSAVAYLNKAIEEGISDNISTYYTQLATSYESLKDFKSAIKYYKAAYESSKSDILLYHLARNYDVYYKDKSQAIAYYKRYLSSDDTIRIAREYTRLRLDELSVYR